MTPARDPAWLVSSYQDVKQLLTDSRLGARTPILSERRATPTRHPSAAPSARPRQSRPSTCKCGHSLLVRFPPNVWSCSGPRAGARRRADRWPTARVVPTERQRI